MAKIILFLFLILGNVFLFAQNKEFDEKFKDARYFFAIKKYNKAEALMIECYHLDSTSTPLLKQLIRVSIQKNKWKQVAFVYRQLQVLSPDKLVYYRYNEILAYYKSKDFDTANIIMNKSLQEFDLASSNKRKYEKLAVNINFSQEAIKQPVPFNPINLGPNVNSKYAEYLPNLTQDGNYLIFTRMTPGSKYLPSLQEDFFVSKYLDNNWLESIPLTNKINTLQNEGAPSISADGKILYFAACSRKDGLGECDIYYSYNRGNYWTSPKNLRAINTEYWESQPNISADGTVLYFVSNRIGGYGGNDIWAVDIASDGSFGEVYNLGPSINTSGDEISPFIHFDNQTLYFASDGWPGMGSKDIFVSRKQANKQWSKPQNLGYPINSIETDNSFFVDTSGELAYFSSVREGGYGKEDIYKFYLYKEAQPQKMGYYKAVVIDINTNKPISVKYEIRNLNDSTEIYLKDAHNGKISMGLKAKQKYLISVFAEGYLYYSSNINLLTEDSLRIIEDKISLIQISYNEKFELRNIEFDFDKSTVRSSSKIELDLFAIYLKLNPEITILIEGHTDNMGKTDYNLKLSEERAKTVRNYLLTQDIPGYRIQAKGFGSTQILSEDINLQEQNRRVVIRIIEK